MSELKHTPGPWTLIDGWDKDGNGKYFPSVILHGDLKQENGRNSITVNVSHDQEIESLMANARLIAAAPESLFQLQKTNKYLKDLIDNDCIKGVGTIATINEMIHANNLQIQKATQ